MVAHLFTMCKGLEPLDILPGLPKLQVPGARLETWTRRDETSRDKPQAEDKLKKSKICWKDLERFGKSLFSDVLEPD